MDFVILNEMACEVVEIPGDGNCLFAAISHQIFGHDVNSIMHKAMTMTMREMVTKFIWAHRWDVGLQAQIVHRVNEDYPQLLATTTEQTMTNFTKLISRNGTWGGSETMWAIHRMFNVNIRIYRESGDETVIESANNGSNGEIRVVYRGQAEEWNHYDSFVRMDKMTPSQPAAIVERADSNITPVRIHGGECHIDRIRPDGNCLFASITHQLFRCAIDDMNHVRYTQRLRCRTVKFIRRNLNAIDIHKWLVSIR